MKSYRFFTSSCGSQRPAETGLELDHSICKLALTDVQRQPFVAALRLLNSCCRRLLIIHFGGCCPTIYSSCRR